MCIPIWRVQEADPGPKDRPGSATSKARAKECSAQGVRQGDSRGAEGLPYLLCLMPGVPDFAGLLVWQAYHHDVITVKEELVRKEAAGSEKKFM